MPEEIVEEETAKETPPAEEQSPQPPQPQPATWWAELGYGSQEEALKGYGELRKYATQVSQQNSDLSRRLYEFEGGAVEQAPGMAQSNPAELEARIALESLRIARPDVFVDYKAQARLNGVLNEIVANYTRQGIVKPPTVLLKEAVEVLDSLAPKGTASVSVASKLATQKASSAPPSPKKKEFRASELRKLQKEKPSEYIRRQPEIMEAYRKGEVIAD